MASPEQPGRKGMSYRKPAPKYIPSPPPSPLSSPVAPFNRMSLSGSPMLDEMPPLPDDWREVIRQAMAANTSTRSFAVSTTNVADIAIPSPSSVLDVTLREQVSPTTVVEDHVLDESLARSPTAGKHRLHRSYRPPTPPIQAHYKRRRSPDDDSGLLSPMVPCRMIYPDLSWLHNSQDAYQTSSMPSLSSPGPSTGGGSFSTLTTSRIPSFKIGNSHCFNATTDPEASTTWPGALSTFHSDTDASLNLPGLPNYHAGKMVKQSAVEERPPELYHFWRRASSWVSTRLRSFSLSESFC